MKAESGLGEDTTIKLLSLFDAVGAYVYAKDRSGRYLYVNKAVCDLYQRPLEDILGHDDSTFMDISLSAGLVRNDRHVIEYGAEVHEEEQMLLLHESRPRSFWTIKVPIRDASNNIIGLSGISSELDNIYANTSDAIRHNRLLNTILSNVDAYIYVKGADGTYLYANQQVSSLYGQNNDDVIGLNDIDIHGPEVAERLMKLDRRVLDSQQRQASEEVLLDPSGAARHFWSVKMPISLPGHPNALIGFSSDITELLTLRQDIALARTIDPLTGLFNRDALEDILNRKISAADQRADTLAVIMLNLDQFKYLNNTLGHAAGDDILRQTAQRLETANWLNGHPARLVGNTFVVVLPNLAAGAGDAASMAERIRLLIGMPYVLNNQPFHLTASLGVSLYPEDADHAQALLANAESAMYHAKELGRDRWCLYSSSLGAAVSERLDLERDLRAALAANQFELYYQPKISARNGQTVGVEALIRWDRPGYGMMAPDRFIPLAEQLGLIVQIGDWVIDRACEQVAKWAREGLAISIAVNLSPAQLVERTLVDRVAGFLERYRIGADMIHMEVTESMMLNDPEEAIVHLQRLRNLGITLSIDDFGTGYSSMAYLKRLPVNRIKLDRSFIQQIATDPREADLCAGIIALAHKLGLSVVAEGVETIEQKQILAAMDCDLFQGYLFSKPLPGNEATRYLRAQAQITETAQLV